MRKAREREVVMMKRKRMAERVRLKNLVQARNLNVKVSPKFNHARVLQRIS
jgi:hypothetical protein